MSLNINDGPHTDKMVMRNPLAVCTTIGPLAAFMIEDKVASFYEDDESDVAREVWYMTRDPVPYGDLLSQVSTGSNMANAVISKLINARLLLVHSERVLLRLITPVKKNRKCKRLLVCMSGSIQSADFVRYLRSIRQEFAQTMRIILTQAACRFVKPLSLSHLLDCDVFVDAQEGDPSSPRRVLHIELSRWATLVLVAPATAATVSRIAHTTSSDLLSQVVAALPERTPLIIGPSMNDQMWTNAGVQHNIEICRNRGYWIIEPGFGKEVSDHEAARLKVGSLGCDPEQLVTLLGRILNGELVARD